MSDLDTQHANVSGAALVKVTLVPVEVFGADECNHCEFSYGLCDAVGAGSDCNRATGRIYRKADEDEPWWQWERNRDDVITVYVPASEVHKLERRRGEEFGD